MIVKYLNNKITIHPIKDIIFAQNDTVTVLKDKIFLSNYEEFISPELLGITDENGVTIKSKKVSEDIDIIYVEQLIDYLDLTLLLENLSYIDNARSKFFMELYSSLKKKFSSLTQNTLLEVLEYIVDTSVPGIIQYGKAKQNLMENARFLSKSLFNRYRILRADLRGIDVKSFIDVGSTSSNTATGSSNHIINYSIILAIIKVLIGTNKLDTHRIIREYPLSANVPFMYSIENKPIIKIHKDFSKELAREILFKHRQQGDNFMEDELNMKRPSGINIKLLNSTGGYTSVYLSKYAPVLVLRCGWTRDQYTTFGELTLCSSGINDIVKTFKNILGNSDIGIKEKIIKFTRTQSIVKKWTNLRFLELQARMMTQVFRKETGNVGTDDKKNTLKLIYIPSETSVIIKNTTITQGTREIKVNSIDILGITEEYRLQIILEYVVKLFYDTNVNYGQAREGPTSAEKVIKNKKIKQLRNSGILMDPVECQKKRQPTMIREREVAPVGFGTLKYKNRTFVCQNKDYPYPGFTHGNIICCFKKDQTLKPAYARNMRRGREEEGISIPDDREILSANVITTDKILDANRLGVVGPVLTRVFSSAFLRLGIPQDKNSFVTAVSVLLGTKVEIDPAKINSDLFTSLEDGQLQNTFISLTEYKKYITTRPLDSRYTSDLVSRITRTNIIIFDISDKSRILCNKNNIFPYKQYIFIVRRASVYEPIVKKVSNEELQRTFSTVDPIVKAVLDLYSQSCEIEVAAKISDAVIPWSVMQVTSAGINVISQVINSFNQITYVNTAFGILPVLPSGPIYKLPRTELSSVKLPALKQYKLLIKSNIPYVYPVGQLMVSGARSASGTSRTRGVNGSASATNAVVVGLVTRSGLIVPVKPSKKIENLEIASGQFFDDIDYVLHSEIPNFDKRYLYTLKIAFSRELYQRFRFTLSGILKVDTSARRIVTDIISSDKYIPEKTKLLRDELKRVLGPYLFIGDQDYVYSQIPSIRNICHSSDIHCEADPFCKKKNENGCLLYVHKNNYINIIKKLTLDLLTSNEILSGTIRKEFLTSDNFVKRANEIILFSAKEIKEFFA